MSGLLRALWLPAIATALVAALGGIYIADHMLFEPAIWARSLGCVAGVSFALAAWVLAANRYYDICVTAGEFLRRLARLDYSNIVAEPALLDGIALPKDHPHHAAGEQLKNLLGALSQRLAELEHAHTASDVRSRRSNAEATHIRAVFAGLAEPILAVDEFEEVTLANRSAKQLLRIGDDSAQRAMRQVVHCQKLIELLSTTAKRRSGAARTEELEITDPTGQGHWYRATATRLGDAQESTSGGAVAVLRDISDHKALQKRNAEFVSAVSHEMKTPLAGIKAYVELLADGDAEDEATREEFLSVIMGQADRLQRLIDNLLNLARIEAGVVQVQKGPRSLNEVLEEALRVVQPSAEMKQIAVAHELSPLYLGVLADRDTLLQAAINLLSNAIKYTKPGGRVTLRSRLDGDRARFDVQDTGVGLSPEDCRKVFEKFYRVKKDKDMAAGTGLGLPLVKHIVEDIHGGEVVVESKLGEGSTFSVLLPPAGQSPHHAA